MRSSRQSLHFGCSRVSAKRKRIACVASIFCIFSIPVNLAKELAAKEQKGAVFHVCCGKLEARWWPMRFAHKELATVGLEFSPGQVETPTEYMKQISEVRSQIEIEQLRLKARRWQD
eukprot:1524859-Amphidinium_carterae.2